MCKIRIFCYLFRSNWDMFFVDNNINDTAYLFIKFIIIVFVIYFHVTEQITFVLNTYVFV